MTGSEKEMLNDSKVENLINLLKAKTRIYLYDVDNEIFSGYVYQLYDNMEQVEDLYISDMTINYDCISVLCYDKWNVRSEDNSTEVRR